MKISVEHITDHPDGSATIAMLLDEEALVAMAVRGIRAAIEDAASKEVANGRIEPEGTEDGAAGIGSD